MPDSQVAVFGTPAEPDLVASLFPDISDTGGPVTALAVHFVRELMNSARIHPAIVEVEESAHGDGVVYGFIVPAHCVQRLHITRCYGRRTTIHAIDEAEKRLLLFGQPRCFQIANHGVNEAFSVKVRFRCCLLQQNSRDRGVGLQSKRTSIAGRGKGRY